MKFIASRMADGNKIFPPEIQIEPSGLSIRVPGFFKGSSQYFDYKQISSVAVDSPLIGYSTIHIFANGANISAHGFTKEQVRQIKEAIDVGKTEGNATTVKHDLKSRINNRSVDLRSKHFKEKSPRVSSEITDNDIIQFLINGDREEAIRIFKTRYIAITTSDAENIFDQLIFYHSKRIVGHNLSKSNINEMDIFYFGALSIDQNFIIQYCARLFEVYVENPIEYQAFLERDRMREKQRKLKRDEDDD